MENEEKKEENLFTRDNESDFSSGPLVASPDEDEELVNGDEDLDDDDE